MPTVRTFTAHPLPGYGSDAPIFERLMKKLTPLTIIEVGVFHGASLIHMVLTSQKLGISPVIIGVDQFEDPDLLPQVEFNLSQVKGNGRVILKSGKSNVAARELGAAGWFAQMIHIDAGHDYINAYRDCVVYWDLLTPGGVMFGHDWKMGNVQQAVRDFAFEKHLSIRVDGEHWELDPK